MFKSATIYRIAGDLSFDTLPAFEPCSASQQKTSGWVPPRGHANGPLHEFVAGQYILKLMIETKAVPAEVIGRKVDEMAAEIESITGRKPGKKQRKQIKDDALIYLLPMAFQKRTAVFVWIDPANKLLVIDSASKPRCDDVVTALISSIDGLVLQMVNTHRSPTSSMASWLQEQEGPQHFTIDRECELKATDESGAVVKYGSHALDIDEVAAHVAQGKLPTKLAMTWDDRVSFVLTEAMTLKKIEILDVALLDDKVTTDDDAFDADVTISTGELSTLIVDLIDALGGEVTLDAAE